MLNADGGVRACWARTRQKIWRSFWGNAASAEAKRLPTTVRLGLRKRATLPVFKFTCSRWPPQKTIKREIDATQRRMAATLVGVKPNGHEEPREFLMRKHRLASALCRKMGWWSDMWFRRALDWDAHIRRNRNSHSWCHVLVDWHGENWLADRRARASGNSATSRTRTRSTRGAPLMRCHSGMDLARSH